MPKSWGTSDWAMVILTVYILPRNWKNISGSKSEGFRIPPPTSFQWIIWTYIWPNKVPGFFVSVFFTKQQNLPSKAKALMKSFRHTFPSPQPRKYRSPKWVSMGKRLDNEYIAKLIGWTTHLKTIRYFSPNVWGKSSNNLIWNNHYLDLDNCNSLPLSGSNSCLIHAVIS